MRNIEVNYRIRLGIGFIFNEPLAALLEGKLDKKDVDIQIIGEDGNVISDFSNAILDVANSFEGHVSVSFKGNVKDKNLQHYFFKGNVLSEYKSMILNTFKIANYALYEADDNIFYFTRCDLKEFSEAFFLEAENVWKIFVDYYSLIYGVSLNASIESVSLSEDGRVCKLKTRGFCVVEKQFNGEMKLNRILPS